MHEPGMLDREERVYGLLAVTTQDPPWAVPTQNFYGGPEALAPERHLYAKFCLEISNGY